MVKTSAGILMYKLENNELHVFLVRPAGPFYEGRHNKIFGIPKGEQDDTNESLFDVAKREFFEETNINPPEGEHHYIYLDNVILKNGKIVYAWAFHG